MEPNECTQLLTRIYDVVDGLTPELVNALTKEVFEQMTCRVEEMGERCKKIKKTRRLIL